MAKNFEPLSARKCPECGSKDYERGVVMQKIITREKGVTQTSMIHGDAGYFRCLKCGFEANP